ncbi:glycosyltransferase family 31 protein [Hypoxylon sp. NC1633]|nr:glycosyltransferase family 31 protein [Hypoxylon sp. NC1633]
MAILRNSYGKSVLTALCIFIFLITSIHLAEWSLHDLTRPLAKPEDPSCSGFPDTSNILVVIKTGASESYSRVPTQMVTVLRCLQDFLIFSDMEQNIAGYHIHDSLDTVLAEAKDKNRDFDIYRRQQACIIDQHSCNTDDSPRKKNEAWTLDKYKNVHIAEKTYRLRPNYDWYLFIDADTYVLWRNLVQWLSYLKNPSKRRYYIGSVAMINGFRFAHGGSGYILSQATMWDLAANHSGVANSYDVRAKESCCGDYILGLALNETLGVGVSHTWPTINGEKPYTISYGPREWCQALEFEKRFYESRKEKHLAMRFQDIYKEFVASKLLARRYDWDNVSEDVLYLDPDNANHHYEQWQKNRAKKLNKQLQVAFVEMNAHKSFEDCRTLCYATENCFQFSYNNGICAYHKSFRLGKPTKISDKEEENWISGWNVEKIMTWIKEQGECKDVLWPGA